MGVCLSSRRRSRRWQFPRGSSARTSLATRLLPGVYPRIVAEAFSVPAENWRYWDSFSRADSHRFCSWGLLVPKLRLGTQGSSGSASVRAPQAGRACQAGCARAEPGYEGISSGAETALAKGTKTGSSHIISLTEFSSLQAQSNP
jgi:hypothetical protein